MQTPEDHPEAEFYGCEHARYVHIRTGTFFPDRSVTQQPILCDMPELREISMYNGRPLYTCVECASAFSQRGLVNMHLVAPAFKGWN